MVFRDCDADDGYQCEQKFLYLRFIYYPKVFHRLPLAEILEELEKLYLLGNGIHIIYEHSVEKKTACVRIDKEFKEHTKKERRS